MIYPSACALVIDYQSNDGNTKHDGDTTIKLYTKQTFHVTSAYIKTTPKMLMTKSENCFKARTKCISVLQSTVQRSLFNAMDIHFNLNGDTILYCTILNKTADI